MVLVRLLALSLALLSAHALPKSPNRNTIFSDEQLPDGPFADMNKLSNVALYNDDSNPFRLPTDTMPSHYNILWGIHLSNFSYTGEVEIFLSATRPEVHEIVIHSSHHQVETTELTQGDDIIPITTFFDSEHHFLRIRPNRNLDFDASLSSQTVYKLFIKFQGAMRDDMYGIYRSWFKNPPDETLKWMASTQFQATAARFAFPCYDEPKFKATFNITIRRPSTYKSWSCTKRAETIPLVNTEYEDDIYLTTPTMSTYLLALIVADYNNELNVQNENNELIYEVIARSGAIDNGQGNYSYEVGQKLLQTMSDNTGIDFYSVNPNLKMTQAAIPDFSAGAMENWGLLTYREAYLMYDEEHTNKNFKQLIAYIQSHEIAHMWFGNLVTCDWWDVVWLNEGFAQYHNYFLTNQVETEMGFEERFITEQVHVSLLSDSANNPQPLTNPGIGSPQSISGMFSIVTYRKGASIIRMTEHLLGSNIHRIGLQNYLKNKAFGTALPIDLFNELQNAGDEHNAFAQYGSDFSLAEYYKSWTEQPGHPVLTIHVDHSTGDMTITQRRFNINSGYSSINNNYVVPITFATPTVNSNFNDTKPTHVLKDTVTVINRGSIGDEWVIFNKQQTGFYRVNYDPYTWNLIAIALSGSDRTLIHEYNRAQIVDDVFQFARSGLMTYTRAFSILSFLKSETGYAPWVAAVTGFNWLRNRYAGQPDLATSLDAMIAEWATEVMGTIGYTETEGETFMTTYLRYQLAPIMCNVGVEACQQQAESALDGLLNNDVEVEVDSRNWVYCNGLRKGSVEDYNRLWTRYLTHNVYTEKIVLLQSLGCTPHAESINSFLDAIVENNELIRPQDYTTAWNSVVSGNEENTLIVFDYIKEKLPQVIDAFGGANTPLSYIYSRLRTTDDVNNFITWATENQDNLGGNYQAVINGAQSTLSSLEWAASNADDLQNYILGPEIVHETTTSSSTEAEVPITSARPNLVQPDTPDLPDSASTTFLSTVLLSLSVVATLLHRF